ncbi:MAG TPA: thioredoxin [Acidimicrobiales bacterium]|nr:thioredoxin [Acidimicrobiales bacterium]
MVCDTCAQKNRVPVAATGVPRCGSCRSPLPWIVDADDTTFADVVTGSALPVLLDVWAPWCGPCRTVSPVLEHLAHQLAGRVKLVKVDADRSPEVSARYGVQAIPTLIVLDGGHPVARQIGAAPEPALRAWLEGALDRAAPDGGPPRPDPDRRRRPQ